MRNETILNVFPSADEENRLVVAIEQESNASSRLVLRQETYSDDVGWFVQSRICVEPEQVAGLKMALTGQSQAKAHRQTSKISRLPAILRFDGACSGNVG